MKVIQYYNTIDTLEFLRKNKIDIKERSRAIDFILINTESAFSLLIEKLWDTEDQKRKAINKILCKASFSYLMLINELCNEILSAEDIQKAINVAIENPNYSYLILIDCKIINEEQRKRALYITMLSRYSTLEFLISDLAREEDRKYIMENIANVDLIDSFFNKIKKKEKLNDSVRKFAFNKLIEENEPAILYIYAKKKYLYKDELKIVYEKYHSLYYNNFKSKFYDYIDFCTIFNEYIHTKYLEALTKKLMKKSRYQHMASVCFKIKFPECLLEKMESYKMMMFISDKNNYS